MIKTSILILGETGNGKSSLGNFILNREIFKTSNNPSSETKKPNGQYGIGETKDIFVIDTPGLQDPEGKDKSQFEQLLKFTKQQSHLQAIIITFDYNSDRFALHIKEMIRLFCKAFPHKTFFEHVAIVWTKYYSYLTNSQKMKRFRKIEMVTKQLIDLISSENHIPPKNFPFFFVDTNFEEKDQFSKEQINNLIAWACNLSYLDSNLTKIVDPLVVEEIEEKRKVFKKQNKHLNKIYTIYSKQKRKKQILYNKTVNYTNWVEFDTESSVSYEPVVCISSRTENKVEKRNKQHIYYTYEGGFWRTLFNNLERVRHVHNYTENILYSRKVNIYNDGTTSFGPWIEQT